MTNWHLYNFGKLIYPPFLYLQFADNFHYQNELQVLIRKYNLKRLCFYDGKINSSKNEFVDC